MLQSRAVSTVKSKEHDTGLTESATKHSRLATAVAHAYDVIEMCAPAAPPIRLRIRTRTLNPNPNPRTHPNPNAIFNCNPNRFF